MKNYLIRCLLLVVSLVLSSNAVWAKDSVSITLLVHPYVSPEQVKKQFSPLAVYLSSKINKEVRIQVSESYNQHIESVGKNQFDIAYIGPYAYVKMAADYGRKPLLGRLEVRGSPTFKGKIVTLIDSPIRTIKDLKNKRMAFGDPSSTMSFIVPKQTLKDNGIALTDLSAYEHRKSHADVLQAVKMRLADAGAVKEEMYYKNMEEFKVIASTDAVSEHVFLANSQTPPKFVNQLKSALRDINQSREGLRAMRSIKSLMTGIVSANHSDYDNLTRIYRHQKAE